MHRFVAMGDGGSGLPAQRKIADELLRRHERAPFDVVLLLGDNIYPNGDTIKYGTHRFTALYKPLLDRDVQFLAVLGNHDIAGPMGVGYPTLWMSNKKENMRFFKMPASYYDVTLGDFHFFMLNTNRLNHEQRDWLKSGMRTSTRSWKIVCGHHPVFSSGFHGNSTKLVEKLHPILEQENARLYLSAHEHDYERFEAFNGVNYLISGGGGADLRQFRAPRPGSLIRRSEHHFLYCELQEGRTGRNTLLISAINAEGQEIDQLALTSLPETAAAMTDDKNPRFNEAGISVESVCELR